MTMDEQLQAISKPVIYAQVAEKLGISESKTNDLVKEVFKGILTDYNMMVLTEPFDATGKPVISKANADYVTRLAKDGYSVEFLAEL